MNISIKSTGIELTESLKDYTEKRIAGTSKFVGEGAVVTVEIGKTTAHHHNGDFFKAEINMSTSLGKQFRAVSEKSDLYEAIDDARDGLVREINSAKGKKDALWKRGARRIKNIVKGFRN